MLQTRAPYLTWALQLSLVKKGMPCLLDPRSPSSALLPTFWKGFPTKILTSLLEDLGPLSPPRIERPKKGSGPFWEHFLFGQPSAGSRCVFAVHRARENHLVPNRVPIPVTTQSHKRCAWALSPFDMLCHGATVDMNPFRTRGNQPLAANLKNHFSMPPLYASLVFSHNHLPIPY